MNTDGTDCLGWDPGLDTQLRYMLNLSVPQISHPVQGRCSKQYLGPNEELSASVMHSKQG